MQKASPKVFHLSGRILRSHTEAAPPTSPLTALRLALDGLRPRLEPLVGADGYRALLSRALALASREHPALATLHLDPENSGAAAGAPDGSWDTAETEAACCAILACLLSLLTSFLGVALTRQMVSGAWPDLAVRDIDFSAEEREV